MEIIIEKMNRIIRNQAIDKIEILNNKLTYNDKKLRILKVIIGFFLIVGMLFLMLTALTVCLLLVVPIDEHITLLRISPLSFVLGGSLLTPGVLLRITREDTEKRITAIVDKIDEIIVKNNL